MKTEALRNLSNEFFSQFHWSGCLPLRLATVACYSTLYTAYRLIGRSQTDSRVAALKWMSDRMGMSRRIVNIRLSDGTRLALDLMSACYLMKEFLIDRMYEALPEFVPSPGQTVIDVGAHQGVFSMLAARKVGASGRVLSVEPAPGNQALLERNARDNGLRNTVIVKAAASDVPGETILFDSKLSTSYSIRFREEGSTEVPVPMRTLDEIAASQGVTRADLIKIDVEGAALKALQGAPALLASKPRIVLEVEGPPAELDAVRGFLSSRNYEVRVIRGIVYAIPRA